VTVGLHLANWTLRAVGVVVVGGFLAMVAVVIWENIVAVIVFGVLIALWVGYSTKERWSVPY